MAMARRSDLPKLPPGTPRGTDTQRAIDRSTRSPQAHPAPQVGDLTGSLGPLAASAGVAAEVPPTTTNERS
jgi:hypothetical protein